MRHVEGLSLRMAKRHLRAGQATFHALLTRQRTGSYSLGNLHVYGCIDRTRV